MDLATVLTASGVGVSVDGEEGEGDHEESDASDAEDDVIKPSDAVLLVAHTEEEYSCVEVQVYDEENGSLYVHHDIALPAFPLALAWMPGQPSAEATDGPSGSFVAVGTFKPGIEIWNLDVLDPLEPTAVLGGEQPGAQPSKPRGKARGRGAASSAPLVDGSHTDAVMALAWNGVRAGYACLASASADTTVKLWDVAAQRCVDTLRVHDGKVQDLCWHPQHASLLASGSFDRTAAIVDTRSAAAGGPCAKCSTTADVESICWNPFATEQVRAPPVSARAWLTATRHAVPGGPRAPTPRPVLTATRDFVSRRRGARRGRARLRALFCAVRAHHLPVAISSTARHALPDPSYCPVRAADSQDTRSSAQYAPPSSRLSPPCVLAPP